MGLRRAQHIYDICSADEGMFVFNTLGKCGTKPHNATECFVKNNKTNG
jgi:hypothetical protein